jgi:hypothetical protein
MILRSVQRTATRNPDMEFIVLSASLVFGIIVAVTMTVMASRAIRDMWRRGVAGVMAVFAAALLSVIAPLGDIVAGRAGLACYAALLTGAAIRLLRVAGKAARQ